jgi:hypothetical protein
MKAKPHENVRIAVVGKLRTLIRRTIESLTDRRAEERRVRLEKRLNRELERLAGRLTRNWPADPRDQEVRPARGGSR